MVKRKRLKYSKIKFNAYLSLNELAQKFLKDTGCSTTEWGHPLRGTECLEFIVTKNIREDFITVQIRYRGHLLGTFQQQDESTVGYRSTEGGSNSFKDLPKSLDVSKLNKAIAELLNYSLTDNIAQFIVTSRRIGEDAGEAKRNYFVDEDMEEPTSSDNYWVKTNNSWEDR